MPRTVCIDSSWKGRRMCRLRRNGSGPDVSSMSLETAIDDRWSAISAHVPRSW